MEQAEITETTKSEEICVLCKQPLVDFETGCVFEKGRQSMMKLSLSRNDGLSQYFKGQKIIIHNKCRKKYCKGNIYKPVNFDSTALKRHPNPDWMTVNKTPKQICKKAKVRDVLIRWQTRVMQQSPVVDNDEPFDFKQYCFICGFGFHAKSRLAHGHRVTKDTVQKHIIKAATQGVEIPIKKLVLHRIENVDLVAIEASYHKMCATRFVSVTSSVGGNKLKKRDKTNKAMQVIYDYIQQSGDIQFSIPQLSNLITEANHDLEILNDRTILKHLQAKYQERIVVVNIPNSGNVITLLEEDILMP